METKEFGNFVFSYEMKQNDGWLTWIISCPELDDVPEETLQKVYQWVDDDLSYHGANMVLLNGFQIA